MIVSFSVREFFMVYGSKSTVVIFVLWACYSSTILILGGEVSFCLKKGMGKNQWLEKRVEKLRSSVPLVRPGSRHRNNRERVPISHPRRNHRSVVTNSLTPDFNVILSGLEAQGQIAAYITLFPSCRQKKDCSFRKPPNVSTIF